MERAVLLCRGSQSPAPPTGEHQGGGHCSPALLSPGPHPLAIGISQEHLWVGATLLHPQYCGPGLGGQQRVSADGCVSCAGLFLP